MAALWTEHRNAEGRTYWNNTITKQSVWEKPDILKTPFERALSQTSWREYFQEGRKYYYNTVTKESKWDMPEELLLLLEKVGKEPVPPTVPIVATGEATNQLAAIASPTNVTSQGVPLNPLSGAMVRPGLPGPVGQSLPNNLPTAPTPVPQRPLNPDEPVVPTNGFAIHEEAEKAFWYLLKKAGVGPDSVWEETIRAIITDPLYKSFNSMAERKESWQKYVETLKKKEAEEKEARMNKQRPAIKNLLKGNPNVFHYTSFETADQVFAQHPIWQQVRIESERRQLFLEYISDLQQREQTRLREMRGRNMEKVVGIFKKHEVDALTRWRDALKMVLESEEWKEDQELSQLPQLDILLAFEDYSKIKSGEYESAVKIAEQARMQKYRQAREGFRALLGGLKSNGKLLSGTKWKEIYPLISEDDRYLKLLGTPGSTPLELFWDAVDELDLALESKVKDVGKYLSSRSFQFTEQTTTEQLETVLREDGKMSKMFDTDGLGLYRYFHEQAAHQRRKTEKLQRRMQDDLRYALKRKAHKFDIDAPYEEVVPIIQDLPEFKALENDDEARKIAFSKFVKRQKEKMREVHSDDGSTSSRKRKEPYGTRMRDHDRERERSREKDRDDRYSSRHRDRDYARRRDDRDRDRERDKRSGRREDDKEKDRSRKKDEDVEMKSPVKETQNGDRHLTLDPSDSPEEGEI
ncbi:hypothetical protein FRC15_006363 [Serendipita sp. 397]|nr:hypothetical protein FRC15_006363 [Serendipita sp. 397]